MTELNRLFFLVLLLTPPLFGAEVGFSFTRDDFPRDFVFGAGTSAYQYEGAVSEDGRTPSIWDNFTHEKKMFDGSTGDIAADGYHKLQEDLKLMGDTGLEAYRLSISWSRLIPNVRGEVNPKGLQYYNNVIDGLVKQGIQPHVTLIHLDYPQALEDEYDGWLNPKIVEDFTLFADTCFKEFGDRVSHWTTINEPNVVIPAAYDYGFLPPGRCSRPFGIFNCIAGNSTVEAYIAMHHVLLAHTSAAKLYRDKYKAIQKGMVGLNLYSMWFLPYTDSVDDAYATQRALDFTIGWALNPLVHGDYPKIMKEIVGSRLPSFSQKESELVRGSLDFLGLNHYVTIYVSAITLANTTLRDYNGDLSVGYASSRTARPIPGGLPVDVPVEPVGLQKMLEYLRLEYHNPPIYIQENGLSTHASIPDELNDTERIRAIGGYLSSVLNATRTGSNVRGYFVWSFMDVFEFLSGYLSRYGLYYVDFDDENRKRTPKASAFWYRDFLSRKSMRVSMTEQSNAALLVNM